MSRRTLCALSICATKRRARHCAPGAARVRAWPLPSPCFAGRSRTISNNAYEFDRARIDARISRCLRGQKINSQLRLSGYRPSLDRRSEVADVGARNRGRAGRYEPRLVQRSIRSRDEHRMAMALDLRFVVEADLSASPVNVPVEFIADVEFRQRQYHDQSTLARHGSRVSRTLQS